MDIFKHQWRNLQGQQESLKDYQGQVILIVNTASQCGLTPQYKGLQKLYDTYKDKGFVILGFPCNQFLSQEPGDHEAISEFCNLNYGVSFPMAEKVKVNGSDSHPLFIDLKKAAPGSLGMKRIQWNFNKFLISRDGQKIKRFSPKTKPEVMTSVIEDWLEESANV